MEITTRGLFTMIHGMGFGTLYLLACTGALVESLVDIRRRPLRQSATAIADLF